MRIRVLTEKDAQAFRAVRLEALQREPLSFGQSAKEHLSLTTAKIAARLKANSVKGSFLLGAFEDGELIATAGFARNPESKKNHKGTIWGVYVKEPHRGKNIARKLLNKLIQLARAQSGLEQITLTVSSGETPAKHIYTALGFQTFGHEIHALKVGRVYVDEDYMILRLR